MLFICGHYNKDTGSYLLMEAGRERIKSNSIITAVLVLCSAVHVTGTFKLTVYLVKLHCYSRCPYLKFVNSAINAIKMSYQHKENKIRPPNEIQIFVKFSLVFIFTSLCGKQRNKQIFFSAWWPTRGT